MHPCCCTKGKRYTWGVHIYTNNWIHKFFWWIIFYVILILTKTHTEACEHSPMHSPILGNPNEMIHAQHTNESIPSMSDKRASCNIVRTLWESATKGRVESAHALAGTSGTYMHDASFWKKAPLKWREVFIWMKIIFLENFKNLPPRGSQNFSSFQCIF